MLDVWYSLAPPPLPPCLSDEERARRDRFVAETLRDDYAAAHALLRHVLSGYAPSHTPGEWRFIDEAGGKPALAGSAQQFNLSHSGPVVAIALARSAVGVDIERHRPLQAAQALVERVFHRDEQRWLAAQPVFEPAFFRLWTLKEALLKAAGTGFRHPPDSLCWHGLDEARATTSFLGRRWTAFSHRVERASIAVALAEDAFSAPPRWWRVEREARSAPLFDTGFQLLPALAGRVRADNARRVCDEEIHQLG